MLRPILYSVLLAGCGPVVGDPSGNGSDTGTTTADPSTSTASPSTVTSSPSTTSIDTTTSEVTTDATFGDVTSSSVDSGAADFIIPPDGGWCSAAPEGTKFHCSQCDVWSQDCPRGEKCTPWANDGGDSWNATTCRPIDPDAGAPGDPCTVDDTPVSGLDTCEEGALCWGVDTATLTGECVALCEESENNPSCPPSTDCLIANDGTLIVCLPTCDPLADPPCEGGDGCHPVDGAWLCLPPNVPAIVNNGGVALTPSFCEPGSTAIDPTTQSFCDPDVELCCTQICDVTAPACAPPLQCVAVGEGSNAGLCVD